MYNKINIDILKELIEGDVHDIYLFIKKTIYKDMYMTIHDYCFEGLKSTDSIETFKKTALLDYNMQNALNKILKVTDGKYFDDYLMNCILGNLYERFPNSKALLKETKENFLEEIYKINTKQSNDIINEHSIALLSGLIKAKFNNQESINIEDLTSYLRELSNNKKVKLEKLNFTSYLNKLTNDRRITLNQLGTESFIKKGIYEISLGKIPTKNQLIMLSISLNLNKEESKKLFDLAKEEIKNSSNSNMYSFEKDNERDNLILHWLNNIESLKDIAKKRNKNVIQILNDILKESNFEILK